MLSYPIPEAEELLTNKLSAAQQSLRNCEEDLDFLREQVTVRCSETFLFLLLLLLPLLLNPSDSFFVPGLLTDFPADHGSCHRARVQLGHLAEAQRGEGAG